MTTDDTAHRCGAKTRKGDPCMRWPATGGKRCSLHGGASPRAIAAAQRRTVSARLHNEVARRGFQPVTNPALLLANVAGEAAAFKDAARARMDELESWASVNSFGTEAVAPMVAIYSTALRDVAQVAERLWRLGLDHKALALEAERPSREQAEALNRVLDRALTASNLDAEQLDMFNAALAEAFAAEGLL